MVYKTLFFKELVSENKEEESYQPCLINVLKYCMGIRMCYNNIDFGNTWLKIFTRARKL